jgi:lipopolysaccharide transport system ATP-binding protein
MTKQEIRSKFDEIVAFAEIEKFIDTPVKRYSSGMYVRLAFAVAAHLEPEILIVDEVLAVGDAEFQAKCLGKMQNVAKGGRTVIFVSHNMAAVRALCGSALLMEQGRLSMRGSADDCIQKYLSHRQQVSSLSFSESSWDQPTFSSASIINPAIAYGEVLELQLGIRTPRPEKVAVEMEIHDEHGKPVLYTSTAPLMGNLLPVSPDSPNQFVLDVGPLNLAIGKYTLYLWLTKPWVCSFHVPEEPLKFEVQSADPFGSGFEFLQSYGRGCFTCATNIRRNE